METVQRITSLQDAASILSIDDERLESQVLNKVGCTKTEWVQWIVSNLEKNDGHFLRLWAAKDESGKVKAYIIAVNAVAPPISRSVFILYQNFFGMKDDEGVHYGPEVLLNVEKWAKELGAKNISIQTDYPRINSKFGFEPESGVSMVKRID